MLENVNELGEYAFRRLEALQAEHGLIGDVRGKGFLIGVEIVEPATQRADPAALSQSSAERSSTG